MLNESLRMIKGTIKEVIQERKQKKNLEKRQTQYVQDIVKGKFPELIVKDEKVAEAIVKWCGDEEDPVKFFLKHLSIMGVKAPVRIESGVSGKEYYFLKVKNNNEEITWEFSISKCPKDFLKRERVFEEKVYYSVRKIPFSILGDENLFSSLLEVKRGDITVRYSKGDILQIHIGKEIEIKIEELKWNNQEEFYPKAIGLIQELKMLDRSFEPYTYYTELKKIISHHYELDNVQITFSTKCFYISTRDGKIIEYKDSIKGVIIKNYNKWSYKEYCTGKEKIVFENNTAKIQGVDNKKIQQLVDDAEKALQEVESLEY